MGLNSKIGSTAPSQFPNMLPIFSVRRQILQGKSKGKSDLAPLLQLLHNRPLSCQVRGLSLNILQIISGREVNGALVYCHLLSNMLAERGHRVWIVCRPGSWMAEQTYSAGVQILHSSMRRLPTTDLRVASEWIRQHRIDLIHTHMTRAHTFGVLLKMITGTPVVATAHSRHFEVHWKFNDYVLANSRSTQEYHQRINWISPSKIQTVYCCPDLTRFETVTPWDVRIVRRQLRVATDKILLGVVGEVLPRKGHWYLFQALPRIMQEFPEMTLVILGRFHRNEAYVRQLRRWLVDNRLFRRTKWLGLRSNVHHFMHAFDITVVPSIEEPLGLVAIESLASETPVIASHTGGLPEIIEHGQTGLLVPPRHPEALEEAISTLASDPDLRHQLGKNGRQFVRKMFEPQSLIDQVEQAYARLVAPHRKAA